MTEENIRAEPKPGSQTNVEGEVLGVVPPSHSGAVITWTTCSFLEGGSSRLRLRMEDGATRGLGPPLHYYPPHIWIQCGPGGAAAGGSAGLLGSLYRTSRGSGKKVLLPVGDVGCKGGGSTKKLPVFGVRL